MTGIIKYNPLSNQALVEYLRFYNFEEPKCPCYYNEGESIRFAGWLIPKCSVNISLVLFLNKELVGSFLLNTNRSDVVSSYNLEDNKKNNGFDYYFMAKDNLTISISIDNIKFDLWSFEKISNENNYKIIEFLGPSGVGKTTLLNKLNPYLRENWAINYSYLEVKKPFHETDNIKKFYKKLIEIKAITLIRNQNIFDLPQLLSHYTIRAQRDFWMISEKKNSDTRYISDEGLFHLFLNEIKDLIISDSLNLSVMRQILENRIIFNCLLDGNKIIENLQQRALEIPGAVHDQIGRYGVNDAFCQIESYKSESKIVIDFIRYLGGRVVDLDFERPIDYIMAEIINELNLV
jgi:hypothetical protein